MSFHAITVRPFRKICPIRKERYEFALFNNGEICGDRLYKGTDTKDPRQQWPFRTTNWMFYKTKAAAEIAASKLQSYLDHREAGKAKSKVKNNE